MSNLQQKIAWYMILNMSVVIFKYWYNKVVLVILITIGKYNFGR